MGYSLIEFDKLKAKYDIAVEVTLGKHSFTSIDQLDAQRKRDVQIIQKTMEILDSLKDGEGEKESAHKNKSVNRELILNAMGIHMRDCIYETYGARSADNSTFYVQLGKALGLVSSKSHKEIPEAQPTPLQKHELMKALYEFMCQNVYNNGNPYDGYLPGEQQPYTTVPNFKTDTFVTDLLKKVHACELESHKSCETNHQKEQKEIKENYKKAEKQEKKGYFPSLNIWSKAPSNNDNSHSSPQLK